MKKIGVKEFKIQQYSQLHKYAEEIRNVNEPLLVICSLDAGEVLDDYNEVAGNFIQNNTEAALKIFEKIKEEFKKQIPSTSQDFLQELKDLFLETEWLLHDLPQRGAGYYQAQIIANAELAFSYVLNVLLKTHQQGVEWLDARDIIKGTDDFPYGKPIYDHNTAATKNYLEQLQVISITQGRIASTMDNENVLLEENPWVIN